VLDGRERDYRLGLIEKRFVVKEQPPTEPRLSQT
jgi:hypothetical protein